MRRDPNAASTAATMSASKLVRSGLLHVDEGCVISPHAAFTPVDALGTARPIRLGAGCQVGPGAVLHGGVHLGEEVRIEEHAVIGKPELGYAVREIHPGAGRPTQISGGSVVRSGAIVYGGVEIGPNTAIGHHTLLRTNVTIGADSQLGHYLSVERAARIGARVRCSPGSHLTAQTVVADGVFLGAGVRTINDRYLVWRDPERQYPLQPPCFEADCKIGTAATIMAGVMVGERAIVGAGTLVLHHVPRDAVVFGVPARMYRQATA